MPGVSQQESGGPDARERLLAELAKAGQEHGSACAGYHIAIDARLGLSPSDARALDLLERLGPLTAGELVAHSGLAPASVTGLIDRLERRGFVRRVRHGRDRRRVIVEVVRARTSRTGPFDREYGRALDDLYAGYSDEQLATILDFMTESAARQREATARLRR